MHKAFFINLFVSPSNLMTLVGEVTEWSKVLAWKVSVPQKGTKGSNPFLSAHQLRNLFFSIIYQNNLTLELK